MFNWSAFRRIFLDSSGGVPNAQLMTNGQFTMPFVGCITNLHIQGKGPLDFSTEAVDGRNVDSCT